ncbi:glycosyltransferase family 2 protein [Mycoplasma sp. P36-A1]|uniref:glycosyltransferase family 2 protein n=1 Tax=Mycoplasma sp. P36-A1 TaxID=3252900 RepID=UPI003C2DF073
MKLISVVIPMYFEEAVVDESYKRLYKVMDNLNNYDYELIFINDGSTDNTLPKLLDIQKDNNKVKIIDFSRNFGHSAAVSAGIDSAKGDAVVLIDADLQDPPEVITEFITKWQEEYDVVYGTRSKRKGESLFKKLSAYMFYAFLDKMSEIRIPRNTGDFRLMDRKVVEALKQMPEKNRFVRGMVSWVGFKQIAVEYERDKRYAGKTKYGLFKMFAFANDAIISFSDKPLKLVTNLGILTLLIDFIFIIYIISSLIFGKTVSGWSSMMLLLTFFFGILFITLGIFGQYIAGISNNVKERPLYIVANKYGYEEEGKIDE